MDCTDLNIFREDHDIQPCRTCGIFYITDPSLIKPIFRESDTDDSNPKINMLDIVNQMNEWNLQIKEDDGRPQYLCKGCIDNFKKLLQFKRNCLDTQKQFREIDCQPVVIKTEVEPEEKFCAFIYIDSDDEEDIEDGSRHIWAPFDIPHVPIKEEHTGRIPQYEPFLPKETPFSQNMNSIKSANDTRRYDGNQNEDEDIIKFTYDNGSDVEELTTLPKPIQIMEIYCKLCGHSSPSEERHTEHMSRMHMLKDCECHICGKKFVNAPESRLRFHMKWHKLQKHLKCPVCGFFCNSKDTLKEHKLAVHTHTKCQFCSKKIKPAQLQAHLLHHIQDHEEQLALKMNSAHKTTVNQTAAPIIQQACIIQCAFCDFTFKSQDQLALHVGAVHKVAPTTDSSSINCSDDDNDDAPLTFDCHICGKCFNLKIKLNRHLKQQHRIATL